MTTAQNDITMVITAFDRNDLLEQTLTSFNKYNTYPIKKTLIIEDSGKDVDYSKVESIIQGDYEIIRNKKNLGQWHSIDKVYSMVETDWIFHCEEDWEFMNSEFIEASLDVFDHYGDGLFTVWGRYHKTIKHPRRLLPEIYTTDQGRNYKLINPEFSLRGYTANPGLRKTEDMMRCHPYCNVIGNGDREIIMANKYIKELGYRSAWIVDSQYWEHIGWGRHVSRDLSLGR